PGAAVEDVLSQLERLVVAVRPAERDRAVLGGAQRHPVFDVELLDAEGVRLLAEVAGLLVLTAGPHDPGEVAPVEEEGDLAALGRPARPGEDVLVHRPRALVPA